MQLVSWPGGSWEATVKYTVAVLAIYLAAIWLTLVFWTYRDIRQRSRDPIVQMVAVLLVLVFFLPGHWIYLILRPRYTLTELYERSLEEEALLQELEDQKACPTCKRRVHDEFLICPSCRTQLKEPCRSCSKPLSYAWLACPFCGLEKPAREGMPPRSARPGARPAPRPSQPQPAGRATPRPSPSPASTAPRQPARDPFGTSQTRPAPRMIGGDDGVIDATAE
jgi:hypothetical protein